jgi:hypothetical protein
MTFDTLVEDCNEMQAQIDAQWEEIKKLHRG